IQQIKRLDHSLLRPNDLADIVKEAEFCLSGTSTYTTSTANKDKASTVKIEDLDPSTFASAIITAFTTAGLAAQPMMNNAVQQRYTAPMQYAPPQQMPQQQQRQAFVQQPIQQSQQPVMSLLYCFDRESENFLFGPLAPTKAVCPPRRPRECYCGGTCQTWRACRVYQEDMANGTLAVDSNGRSMLRNGSRTWPRGPGTLHDRVLQWNRENPDAQLPSGQTFLLETIPSRKDYSHIPLSASIVSATAFESVIAEQQVTESSGDSTRFGHVGVRTRVTRESHTQQMVRNVSRTRRARLSCLIRRSGPSPEATRQRLISLFSTSTTTTTTTQGVTIVAPAALTIVRQPMCCCCLCDSSRLGQQLDGRLDGDDDWIVTTTGPRRRLNGANSLTVATAPTQPR
ncbi:hypothetical protein BDZ89DRAFT_1043673, partial [Hymenopellis radicata]